jgi:hypothetical protein
LNKRLVEADLTIISSLSRALRIALLAVQKLPYFLNLTYNLFPGHYRLALPFLEEVLGDNVPNPEVFKNVSLVIHQRSASPNARLT